MGWEQEGNSIAQAILYLGLPDAVIAAMVDELGLSVEDHMGSIAFIKDEEWEDMLGSIMVEGAPAKVGHKAKLRRLLAICRLVCAEAPGGQDELDEASRTMPEMAPRTNVEDKPAGEQEAIEAIATARLPQSAGASEAEASVTAAASTPPLTDIRNKVEPPAATVKMITQAAPPQAVTVQDDLTAVKLSEVVLQGCDIKVPMFDLRCEKPTHAT